ncbi:matrixin family metalloprotease [Candidatus Pacearchaeota archaeon]|nr:matrixin family metalloprotease [Candidatus Pacearchaeota archaeon]
MEIESIAEEHEEDRTKLVLGVIFLVIVVGLLVLYWIIPNESLVNLIGSNGEFLSCSEFEFGNMSDIQFYPNMRYVDSNISYRIGDCNIHKTNDAIRAFNEVENKTALSFYEVSEDEEILISCDSVSKIQNGMFIAGEGGPSNITKLTSSYVILQGQVLLLEESSCGRPIVAIHEIFHTLGFTHSNNVCNIMYNSSKCSQEIGQDMIKLIDELYSYDPLPDLEIINVYGKLHDEYMDLNFSVRNDGLMDSGDSSIRVYSGNNAVKEIDIGVIELGAGVEVVLKNVLVGTKADNISILILHEFEEFDKDNNLYYVVF